ncbi:MAG: hypothetical protein NTW04_04985, partial [Elusimicrobia bacterium]|nr:hypothetical protein [Elusimicrobiota bacterium]
IYNAGKNSAIGAGAGKLPWWHAGFCALEKIALEDGKFWERDICADERVRRLARFKAAALKVLKRKMPGVDIASLYSSISNMHKCDMIIFRFLRQMPVNSRRIA